MSYLVGISDQSEPVIGFITKWTVSGDVTARTITLPLINTRSEGALAYDCTVDWGDGTATSHVASYNDANRIHTYASNGTYNVEIRGTCEGWSFNYGGDRLKIVEIVNWGTIAGFNGFKFLSGGFYGCSNLTSLGVGTILASGSGILSQGFNLTFAACPLITTIPVDLFIHHVNVTVHAFDSTFLACSALVTIPKGLFRYNILVSQYAFQNTFSGCHSLTSIPIDLFYHNTQVSFNGFLGCFANCYLLASIPADLFRYNTLISTGGFSSTFYQCYSLTSIPSDLFKYNTLVDGNAFQQTFYFCTSLASIPTDLFRYNTLPSANGFRSCFYGCSSLTSIPIDIFRYNTLVSTYGFRSTFNACSSLATVPSNLFRYNAAVSVGGFQYTFMDCVNLQLNKNIFFADSEESTRFLNISSDFTNCFIRDTFSGTQGEAPDLWDCDFGETITLDIAPTIDWSPDDIITGQSSGATAVVVSKVSTLIYKIKQHNGTFTLDEIVGVTGDSNKLADQGASNPIFIGTPISIGCFTHAGNSLASISNYNSIPTDWE